MEIAYINAVGFNGEKLKIELSDKLKEYFKLECNKGEFYIVKKESQYPNTYEECCKVLFPNSMALGKVLTIGYNCELLEKFGKLLICRDAYWKIAGEQMGFDKPWEYDMSKDEFSSAISYEYGYIQKYEIRHKKEILIFPTVEMRDAFYENFKELIEQCKELL